MVETSVDLMLRNHCGAKWAIIIFINSKIQFMPSITASNAIA